MTYARTSLCFCLFDILLFLQSMVKLDVKAMYLDPKSCSYNVYWGFGVVLLIGSFFWFTFSFHAL